jgi:hypothetical protein
MFYVYLHHRVSAELISGLMVNVVERDVGLSISILVLS